MILSVDVTSYLNGNPVVRIQQQNECVYDPIDLIYVDKAEEAKLIVDALTKTFNLNEEHGVG